MDQVHTMSPMQYTTSRLNQASWISILRGCLAIIVGVVALVRPGIAISAIVLLFGIYAVIQGILALYAAFRMGEEHEPWLGLLFEGVLCIAAAIIAFRTPGLTATVLVFMVGAWWILVGALEIAAASQLRKLLPNEWALDIAGVLSIIAGMILFWQPLVGMISLAWIFGIYAILFGVVMIRLGVALRKVMEA